jgi:hypothetical protein
MGELPFEFFLQRILEVVEVIIVFWVDKMNLAFFNAGLKQVENFGPIAGAIQAP